jgi:protein gp37
MQDSKIQWTHHTFNPWIGCSKVSPGCANCYAETLDKNRFSKTLSGGTKDAPVSHWGKGAPRQRTSAANWKQPLRWDNAEFPQLVGIERPRVFCASLADWLDDEVPIEWLADLLDLIRRTPHLDWLLLTKRPQNWRGRIFHAWEYSVVFDKSYLTVWLASWLRETQGTPPANVWIGTSTEDQARADERIPLLLNIPAKVRFLSMEPLLGPVEIRALRKSDGWTYADRPLTGERATRQGLWPDKDMPRIHWVIAGGESGPKARSMHLDWAKGIRRQCEAASVPFFMKQLGADPLFMHDCPYPITDKKGATMEDWPESLQVRQFPST